MFRYARPLAGGTDVIVQARERRREIDLFVDIKHIPALMEITHVIRGDDHLNNAFRQLPIYRAMGWAEPRRAVSSAAASPLAAPESTYTIVLWKPALMPLRRVASSLPPIA